MLEMYNDVGDLMRMCEATDYQGHDMFWYLDEYDLYNIMDCRIMDNIIQKKWNGKFEINATLQDYSTSVVMVMDKYGLFATDRVFDEMRFEMFTLDRHDLVHLLKYEVWKNSMMLRAMIDLIFSIGFLLFF